MKIFYRFLLLIVISCILSHKSSVLAQLKLPEVLNPYNGEELIVRDIHQKYYIVDIKQNNLIRQISRNELFTNEGIPFINGNTKDFGYAAFDKIKIFNYITGENHILNTSNVKTGAKDNAKYFFSADGRQIIILNLTKNICTSVDAVSGNKSAEFSFGGDSLSFKDAVIIPETEKLLLLKSDTLFVWSLQNMLPEKNILLKNNASKLRITPFANKLAYISGYSELNIIDLDKEEHIFTKKIFTDEYHYTEFYDFSPDMTYLLYDFDFSNQVLYNLKEDKEVGRNSIGGDYDKYLLAISNDGEKSFGFEKYSLQCSTNDMLFGIFEYFFYNEKDNYRIVSFPVPGFIAYPYDVIFSPSDSLVMVRSLRFNYKNLYITQSMNFAGYLNYKGDPLCFTLNDRYFVSWDSAGLYFNNIGSGKTDKFYPYKLSYKNKILVDEKNDKIFITDDYFIQVHSFSDFQFISKCNYLTFGIQKKEIKFSNSGKVYCFKNNKFYRLDPINCMFEELVLKNLPECGNLELWDYTGDFNYILLCCPSDSNVHVYDVLNQEVKYKAFSNLFKNRYQILNGNSLVLPYAINSTGYCLKKLIDINSGICIDSGFSGTIHMNSAGNQAIYTDCPFTLKEYRLNGLISEVDYKSLNELYTPSVFPNPAADFINISDCEGLDFGEGKVNIWIIDITGRIVKEKVLSEGKNIKIDISDLPPGTYRLITPKSASFFVINR